MSTWNNRRWVATAPRIQTKGEIIAEYNAGWNVEFWLYEDGWQFGRQSKFMIGSCNSLESAKARWRRIWGTGWSWKEVHNRRENHDETHQGTG